MSCPHFYPTESQGGSALFPLGDYWTGICHADPANPLNPTNTHCCNFGYARGACAHFPDDAGPDAVRFTIVQADSTAIRLYFVQERDHHPFAHGPLDYSLTEGFSEAPGPLLERQASAYIASYRRRVQES